MINPNETFIHLIAPKDKRTWSEIWVKCYNIWMSSPYKIKLWDDEEIDPLLNNENPEFFQLLNKCPKIYKYDYARYFILEEFGGAYFDMDVEIHQDFLHLLKNDKVYFAEGFLGGIEGNIIVNKGKIRHIFYHLRLFIQDILRKSTTYNWEDVIEKTGPYVLSTFLGKYMMHNRHDVQLLSYLHFANPDSDIKFATHHFTNSWHGK